MSDDRIEAIKRYAERIKILADGLIAQAEVLAADQALLESRKKTQIGVSDGNPPWKTGR